MFSEKYNKFLAILIVIISTLFLPSCKKTCQEKGNCPPEFYNFTLGEAKDYLWAEKGSFWIYKNTKTGELDTQTCVGYKVDVFSNKGTYDYSQHVTVQYEKLNSTIYTSKYKRNIYQYTNSVTANSHTLFQERVILTRETHGGLANCFYYPIDSGYYAGTASHTCRFSSLVDTLVLQGKTFYNVLTYYVSSDNTWGDNPPYTDPGVSYFWCKGIGIIKKVDEDKTEAWELLEYNIVR
jgi:hypothetical protein